MIRPSDIRLAVMTARRSPEYIHATLASLFVSDPLVHHLKGVHLVVGGNEAEYLHQYRHHRRINIHLMGQQDAEETCDWPQQRRCCFNLYRALTILDEDCQGLCICEDDVIFQEGFLSKLLAAVNEIEKTQKPADYLLTAYLPYGAEQLLRLGKASTKNNAHTFYGNQCVYYPRGTATELAQFIYQNGVVQQFGPSDLLVREYAAQKNALYGTVRSLVQHVGFHSTGFPQFFHRAASFHEESLTPESASSARIPETERVKFDLREGLSDVIAELSFRAQRKGLELIYHVACGVPETVVGDPGRLRQMLSGFLKSAIDRTSEGEVVVRINVESVRGDDVWLHFAITDSGIGISLGERLVIGDAALQGNSFTDRKFGASAPGQTISSRLAKTVGVIFQALTQDNRVTEQANGGGRTWVEDRSDGQGNISHFTVRLSLMTRAVEFASSTRPIEELKGLPVLIADDNANSRHLLVEMLSDWGVKPIAVSGGRPLLELLQQKRDAGASLGLVLLDADMPEMDGYAVVRQIKKNSDLTINVIMMVSAGGNEDAPARCREVGVCDYLKKPILYAELLQALRYFVAAFPDLKRPTAARTEQSVCSGGIHS